MSHHTTRRRATLKDETGNRYGRLTVIEQAPPPEHLKCQDSAYWRCHCECGNIVVVLGASLRKGNTASCGCLQRAAAASAATTHGMYKSAEYRSWQGMKARCHDPANKAYFNYGARGVAVCDRWRNSFAAFLEDMGPKPSPTHSLDRIDNNGDYSPDNCRWATREQQQNNLRTNRMLTYNGKTQSLSRWAKELGIRRKTIGNRLSTGCSAEEALFVGELPNSGRFQKGRRNP
jgi:hypothetical protein